LSAREASQGGLAVVIQVERRQVYGRNAARRKRLLFAGIASGMVWLTACGPAPSVDQGKKLYQTNGCVSCHGASGRGDGALAASLLSKPANLHAPDHFKRGASEAEIAKTLAEGIVDPQLAAHEFHLNHHDLAMPKFDHLSEVERRSIALYVISMAHDAD
jgi:high-affinity iron transporter